MTIVGIKDTKFTGKDGTNITGKTIYYTYSLAKGEGVAAEHFFISTAKLKSADYVPSVGDDVQVLYNRFGKVERMLQNNDINF